MGTAGATNEVAALKEAVSAAERNAATEWAEREKQEARVAVVQQELQALMEKHEGLERDSKTRESELTSALESAKSAKAEAHKALQEVEDIKKMAAGKAFFMHMKKWQKRATFGWTPTKFSQSCAKTAMVRTALG